MVAFFRLKACRFLRKSRSNFLRSINMSRVSSYNFAFPSKRPFVIQNFKKGLDALVSACNNFLLLYTLTNSVHVQSNTL